MENIPESKLSGEISKSIVFDILASPDWEKRLIELSGFPLKKLMRPLFSALFSADPQIKWHAVSAFAIFFKENDVKTHATGEDIIRRCMWNLNEESGAVPWSMAEVMAEIMANQKSLAIQFRNILFSYITETAGDDNYLQFDKLRTGVYWGIMRLSEAFPELVKEYEEIIYSGIKKESLPENIIYIILTCRNAKLTGILPLIKEIQNSSGQSIVYYKNKILTMQIKEAVHLYLGIIENNY